MPSRTRGPTPRHGIPTAPPPRYAARAVSISTPRWWRHSGCSTSSTSSRRSDEAVSSPFNIGDVVGGFRLQSKLGEGGMGVIWLAEEQNGQGRRAAVKVLSVDLARNGEIRERFLRESAYAERVKHPNIAEVYGAGEQGGSLWLAMRYLGGTD